MRRKISMQGVVSPPPVGDATTIDQTWSGPFWACQITLRSALTAAECGLATFLEIQSHANELLSTQTFAKVCGLLKANYRNSQPRHGSGRVSLYGQRRKLSMSQAKKPWAGA